MLIKDIMEVSDFKKMMLLQQVIHKVDLEEVEEQRKLVLMV